MYLEIKSAYYHKWRKSKFVNQTNIKALYIGLYTRKDSHFTNKLFFEWLKKIIEYLSKESQDWLFSVTWRGLKST